MKGKNGPYQGEGKHSNGIWDSCTKAHRKQLLLRSGTGGEKNSDSGKKDLAQTSEKRGSCRQKSFMTKKGHMGEKGIQKK